ncbi:MAG: ankyrin repeat domain-containing protein [Acidobacteria bacterium]|nr:ankyrin repeat domain-containing protein [Acidobacteriota bacterium]
MTFVKRVLVLGGSALCLLLLSHGAAHAQQVPPLTYLFVEVKDSSGKPVADAEIALSGTTQGIKTNKDGLADTSFRLWQMTPTYEMRVSKPGYLTSEHVLFLGGPDRRLREDFPLTAEDFANAAQESGGRKPPPVGVTLLKLPATPAERRAVESEEQRRKLLLAAKRGDAAGVRKLLEAGVGANTADARGVPVIAWAAAARDEETIKALLDAGAEVRNKNALGHRALLFYLAGGVRSDGRYEYEEGVRMLLKAGAGVNVQDSYRGTVLGSAVALAQSSAQPDLSQPAAPFASVKLLLAAGADVNAADVRGQTPLMAAAQKPSADLIKLMLEAGARRSVNAKNGEGQTALMLASERSDVESIKTLLAAGADLDAKDRQGRTALMYAHAYKYRPASLDAVKLLLAAGARVNDADNNGRTPLMLAVQDNFTDEVKTLLAAGARASINARDGHGKTALLYVKSVFDEDASAEIIKVLAAAGADLDADDDDGQTLLMKLAAEGFFDDPIRALLEAGARASVDAKDRQGRTALMFAAGDGMVERVKILLGAGAALGARDDRGQTVLMHAVLGYPCRSEVVKFLTAAGLSLTDVNEDGQTPLMLAAQVNWDCAVRQLLEAGAPVDSKDKRGRTALTFAREAGNSAVVALLEEAERRR